MGSIDVNRVMKLQRLLYSLPAIFRFSRLKYSWFWKHLHTFIITAFYHQSYLALRGRNPWHINWGWKMSLMTTCTKNILVWWPVRSFTVVWIKNSLYSMIHRDDANMHLFSESKKVLHQIDFVHHSNFIGYLFIYSWRQDRKKFNTFQHN